MEEEKTPEKFVFQILVQNGCNDSVNNIIKVYLNYKGVKSMKIYLTFGLNILKILA